METAAQPARGPDQKYCGDCGKLILLRAEICPQCGCRQLPVPAPQPTPVSISPSSMGGKVIALFILNFFWNGLGNIAIGDKRGWSYGFGNWIAVIIGTFTAFVPVVLFFCFCGLQGFVFLSQEEEERKRIESLPMRD